MLKACSYCGRIHAKDFDCGRKPKRPSRDEAEVGYRRAGRKWHDMSLRIRDRSHFLCAVCLEDGVLTHDHLEVHHITKASDNPAMMYDPYNLICLCQRHHELAEHGRISADHLRELARGQEERHFSVV